MAVFQDRKNREWSVEITPLTIERIREQCDINLVDMLSKPEAFPTDPITIANVLAAVLEPEDVRDFKNSLGASQLDAGFIAILRAFGSFLGGVREKAMNELADAVEESVKESLERLSEAMNKEDIKAAIKHGSSQ